MMAHVTPAILPWQESQWQAIQARIENASLPHALLLSGPEGLGKQQFAYHLALSLLCTGTSADGAHCGRCRGCKLNRAGNHPDLIIISPLPDKKEISIDQIRQLKSVLTLKPQYGTHKVIIINPADALNHYAANSLLKTLEEPSPGCLLLLCSSRPARLSATIRSRCQNLPFQCPESAQAKIWLAAYFKNSDTAAVVTAEQIALLLTMADAAPLKAIAIAASGLINEREALLTNLEQLVQGQLNPSKLAEQWLKLGAKESLYWLYSWISDMIRLAMTAEQASVNSPGIDKQLQAIANTIGSQQLFQHLDKTSQVIMLLDQPLNQQLMFEELLLPWCKKS